MKTTTRQEIIERAFDELLEQCGADPMFYKEGYHIINNALYEYKELILLAYRQTAGIKDDVFTKALSGE